MATYEGPSIDTTSPVYTGPILRRFPFLDKFGDTTHVIYSQKYIERWEDYTALALNTTTTIEATTVYHIGDVGLADVGTGCVEYFREYATVPATHYDGETSSVTFPALYETRDPTSQTAFVQIEYAYYLVGPGQTYETIDELPLVAESRVTDTNGLDVHILSGGSWSLNDGGGVLFDTTPSLTTYQTAVAAADFTIVIDSKPEHYAGGIWAVVTRYVQPK